MKIDFEDQVVLITGATRGIGKQLADDFAKAGARLLLTGTHKVEIDHLNHQARRNRKVSRKYYAVDFSHPESLSDFLEEMDGLRQIDVCINNAGINRINFINKTRQEDLKDILAVNLEAPFYIVRTITPSMRKNRYGRIVNIASIFGVLSKAKRSLYSISKFGLRGLTISAAIELARFNILVNAVSPGFVLTDLTKRILGKKEMDKLSSQIPVGRFAKPSEITPVVLFLASRLNTYLTGQNIVVDGGFVNV